MKIGMLLACPACGEKSTLKFTRPSAIGQATVSHVCGSCDTDSVFIIKRSRERQGQMDVTAKIIDLSSEGRNAIQRRKALNAYSGE